MTGPDHSIDGFLGQKLQVTQPLQGYRAGSDAVFLAAAVPAVSGEAVLELGLGTGVASLCLAHRVPGLRQFGIEMQGRYAALARDNFARNGFGITVFEADAGVVPDELAERPMDHVMFNPPFFDARSASAPADGGRRRAHTMAAGELARWCAAGLRRLRPGGRLTLIHRAQELAEILAALGSEAGDIAVLPIASRAQKPAHRVIVTGLKGRKGPLRLLPPLVVHAGAGHSDGDDLAAWAHAVLRDGAAISLEIR